MSTYRERREAKADRLRGWAGKREETAAAVFAAGEPYRGDIAFATQPGHIPLRARVIAREDRAHQSLNKAHNMRSRADGIEDQLTRSIYSDDPDAVEQLEARLVVLEAERDRIKRYNASCRKGARDLTILTDREQTNLLRTAEVAPYSIGKRGEMPAYHLSNLSGNIKRNRDRLASLKAASA